MNYAKQSLPTETHDQLKQYVYPIIGLMHEVYKDLGCGMPEYIYQEALYIELVQNGYKVSKEYIHHPQYHGKTLESFIRMDMVVEMPRGNIIIECKSIGSLSDRERHQTHGYLRATGFPIALLVNFGEYPRATVERYYWKDNTIWPF